MLKGVAATLSKVLAKGATVLEVASVLLDGLSSPPELEAPPESPMEYDSLLPDELFTDEARGMVAERPARRLVPEQPAPLVGSLEWREQQAKRAGGAG